ncbi:hypothetical protein METHB2_260019 [Candidatus Methylobacter favarea]|uniref:Uncharacterized protein n=1 Tax=Candidatus Methylobacter favarea TaxID=2707345 RepID=A0A8S0X825_9GAMM|nr:hypothetical protein METHB2_260019 [Candidatus Methylobacter favarea]
MVPPQSHGLALVDWAGPRFLLRLPEGGVAAGLAGYFDFYKGRGLHPALK